MRLLLAALFSGLATATVAATVFVSDDRLIHFADGYMVVQSGDDAMLCQSDGGPTELIVECPDGAGGVTESVVTITATGLNWHGKDWAGYTIDGESRAEY